MVIDENILEEIVLRAFRGECTPGELEQLREWINASPENECLYKSTKAIVEMSSYLKGIERLDKKQALQRVMQRAKRPKRLRVMWLKYAAVIALPLLLGGIAYYWLSGSGQKQLPELVVKNVIQPGGMRAVLYLSDGQVVDLQSLQDSVITDDSNRQMILLSKESGVLDYHQASRGNAGMQEDKYNKIVVPRGGEYVLILSDGTKVWLNSETELEYPLAFGKEIREVRLKGEAYFEVRKDTERRFHVIMGDATIEVTGTSFNASCYPGDGTCRAVLESGKINLLANHKVQRVAVGECATYDKTSKQISVEAVDLKYYTAWRHGTFYFYDTPLSAIVEKLERWYDVKFSFADDSLKEICFSGAALRSKPIDVILQLLASTQSLKFDIQKDGKILIDKK